MVIVLDEWIFYDLGGNNCHRKQQEALGFLKAIIKNCDSIVYIKNSEWERKFHQIQRNVKNSSNNLSQEKQALLELAIKLFLHVRVNSSKMIIVEFQQGQLSLPDGVDMDDEHIIYGYVCIDSDKCCIVTTDERLIKALKSTTVESKKINIYHRDEFISNYLGNLFKKSPKHERRGKRTSDKPSKDKDTIKET